MPIVFKTKLNGISISMVLAAADSLGLVTTCTRMARFLESGIKQHVGSIFILSITTCMLILAVVYFSRLALTVIVFTSLYACERACPFIHCCIIWTMQTDTIKLAVVRTN